ncbi:MAG: DUF4349 domain-containing protein [Anaerolineae bacterium]|nr:DUF4349 domain-containing protein [Anaerolineae bacterium]
MKSRITLLPVFLLLGMLVLNACGASAAEAPEVYIEEAAATEAPAQDASNAPVAPAEGEAASTLKEGSVYETGSTDNVAVTTHLIIKNADMRLLVEDSDVAIDRITQAVGDSGGYIISSRVWNQAHFDGKNYKYATITMGVPVLTFERTLNRLRDLSLDVLDENASGEDVTDQYVDLQSQLVNLEATRERIKSFLDQAKTVEEALLINQQLSEIERQIEEIKGRINYLQDRSSFSTITVNIEPKLPEYIPPTPTPTPTPMPEEWKPGETVSSAWQTLTKAYQGFVDLLIWVLLVFVPIFGPPILIIWVILKLVFRKPNKPS